MRHALRWQPYYKAFESAVKSWFANYRTPRPNQRETYDEYLEGYYRGFEGDNDEKLLVCQKNELMEYGDSQAV